MEAAVLGGVRARGLWVRGIGGRALGFQVLGGPPTL